MRALFTILSTIIATVLLAQCPDQFQGGGPDISNPLTFTGPDTFLLNIDSLFGFNYSNVEDFYDEDTDKIIWRKRGEGYSVRVGGNWRVPDAVPYAKFGVYTSVGNGANFTRLGQEYSIAYHRGWEQLNEQNIIGGGDSILTDSAGMIFLVVHEGTVEIANLNLLIKRTNGNASKPIDSLANVNIATPTTGDIIRYDGTSWTNAKAYTRTVVWAEENGAISAGQREYSFGNGAVGNDNFGLPIWENMDIVGMVMNAETSGTSATIVATINATNIASSISATGTTTVTYFPSEIPVSQGDLLNFRTVSVSGTWSDVRVGVIVETPIHFRE